MKTISLTKGYCASVDDEDFCRVNAIKWQVTVKKLKTGEIAYASHHFRVGVNKRRHVKMHNFILQPAEGYSVDHQDGNGLNNCRHNLRYATCSQNTANSRNYNKSGLKGISQRPNGSWRARITLNGRTRDLGTHPSKDLAAMAYDKAAVQVFGDFARTNYPAATR